MTLATITTQRAMCESFVKHCTDMPEQCPDVGDAQVPRVRSIVVCGDAQELTDFTEWVIAINLHFNAVGVGME